uniref:RGS domain-containing protein n=1 Tax=Heterorhabditis bacteriophora TaxID=37862 RepID=A0A1I7XJ37_HETBA
MRKSATLAYNLDLLLLDSSALSFFIQFLESCVSLLDARNIFDKYIDEESTSTISLPRKIKHRIDENLMKQPLKVDCFDDAQHFVRQLFELRYFPEFQASIYYKKHELYVLSRGCSLFDIIHVQFLLLSFLEYVDSRSDHDCVQFLIACESFENSLESLSDEDALNDAMSIYDKLIALFQKYLHRFIHSSAYHNYLVDLSAQIQNTV